MTAGTPGPPTGPEPSDRDLLAAHVAGDPDAFDRLVRRHTPRLWAVAVRTLRGPDDAADALQDALVSAYRNAGSFRGDAAVTTWLHRIVVNACLDRRRRDAARPTVPLPDHHDPPHPRDDHDAVLSRIDLTRAMALLPDAQRTAIVLVDLHDLSVGEAAQVLGVAEGTVKSRCSRGRAALAAVLRGPHAEDPADPADPDRDRPAGPGGNRRASSPVEGPGAVTDDPVPARETLEEEPS